MGREPSKKVSAQLMRSEVKWMMVFLNSLNKIWVVQSLCRLWSKKVFPLLNNSRIAGTTHIEFKSQGSVLIRVDGVRLFCIHFFAF